MEKFVQLLNRLPFIGWAIVIVVVLGGLIVNPHGKYLPDFFPYDPVPVDLIPDLSENQHIVIVQWEGQSPREMEDQVTYPLVTYLLGIPGVKVIRATSMFEVAYVYIIFEEEIDFYWARSRILERLNSIPAGLLPRGVVPRLGPDATAVGQVFWYTLEGRDPRTGEPAGGWDLHELRTINDFYVRPALASVPDVSEVSPIGGFIREYHVQLDIEAMRRYDVSLEAVLSAVKNTISQIGAGMTEVNRVEYFIRGLGYLQNLEELQRTVVRTRSGQFVYLEQIAHISWGPGPRRGGLDKGGVEAVGGVVLMRYGANPLEVIQNVKKQIDLISASLPEKTLPDGRISKVTIVPFYDRSVVIREALGTLERSLTQEILITVVVILVFLTSIRTSLVVSALLPLGLLATFLMMKGLNLSANIVSLAGIAIAIGVMVDIGIVIVENIVQYQEKGESLREAILRGITEVTGPVITAQLTTLISFLPVFLLTGAEGKLFRPLAWTKTLSIGSAVLLGLVALPVIMRIMMGLQLRDKIGKPLLMLGYGVAGVYLISLHHYEAGVLSILLGINELRSLWWKRAVVSVRILIAMLLVLFVLTQAWMPLGPAAGLLVNVLFVAVLVLLILGYLYGFVRIYRILLHRVLQRPPVFLIIATGFLLWGYVSWQGIPGFLRNTAPGKVLAEIFPGLGKEFMPTLDEGSFLAMPITMPHASVEEVREELALMDALVQQIPEVEIVVGKWGRVESPVDPAPINMFENIIIYRPEYAVDASGKRLRFRVDKDGNFILRDGRKYNPRDSFMLVDTSLLIPDPRGQYLRQWRPHIRTPDDIWAEISETFQKQPWLTAPPKLHPIETRLIMLQTGMRARLGMVIYAPTLDTLQEVLLRLEQVIKQAPYVNPYTVYAERLLSKPYLELKFDREALARYGLTVGEVQRYVKLARFGEVVAWNVEGREYYPVRIKLPRDFTQTPHDITRLWIPTPAGEWIPLERVAEIQYRVGPQAIKSENAFLVGYLTFEGAKGLPDVDVVEKLQSYLDSLISAGALHVPAGVTWRFAGAYENYLHAMQRLAIILPLTLLIVFVLLYVHFRGTAPTLITFSAVLLSFAGGFIVLWLWNQDWFLNFHIGEYLLRDVFNAGTVNLNVAVWVGFIALLGIATDSAVLLGSQILDLLRQEGSRLSIRDVIIQASMRRVRPATMTVATTLIALLPVLTSTGKGSEILVPIILPGIGGMIIQPLVMLSTPLLFYLWLKKKKKSAGS